MENDEKEPKRHGRDSREPLGDHTFNNSKKGTGYELLVFG